MTDQQTTTKLPKGRSPSYPGVPLAAAIDRAKVIYDHAQRLVLTHPEGWAPSRIAALREAAHRGGFRAEIVTVPKLTAAFPVDQLPPAPLNVRVAEFEKVPVPTVQPPPAP